MTRDEIKNLLTEAPGFRCTDGAVFREEDYAIRHECVNISTALLEQAVKEVIDMYDAKEASDVS